MYTGIVHTMTFSTQVTEKEINNIKLYQVGISENNRVIFLEGKGFKITIAKKSRWLFLFIDAIEFTGCPIIVDQDIEKINEKIKLIFETLEIELYSLNLTRFDFRIDVKMSPEDRKLYFKLIEKIQSKRNWLWRVNFEEYKHSSAYFNSNSKKTSAIKLNIYDKEKERMGKNMTPEDYEENVIRFEIQLNNSHLRYHYRTNGISRTIEEYLHIHTIHHYFEKYLKPIFFSGNYYDINMATKIINNEVRKKSTRVNIREFLVYVSRNNIDAAKKNYSEYKFRKYTKLLEGLEINPILIPKNQMTKYMENPMNKFFRGIFENM